MSEALGAALKSLMQPGILRLVWLPLLGALGLWILLGAFFWHDLVTALQHLIAYGAAEHWLSAPVANVLSEWIVTVLLLLALWPLSYATALFITSIIAMPILVNAVAARDHPQLARRRGGTAAGSFGNALWATLLYLFLWIVSLPLWLFGVPALVLPLLINGWYNNRLFRYDALAEHASREEFRALARQYRGAWFSLGVVAAALQLVPVVNFFAPVYTGLSFIHFGLARLERLRAPDARAPAVRD